GHHQRHRLGREHRGSAVQQAGELPGHQSCWTGLDGDGNRDVQLIMQWPLPQFPTQTLPPVAVEVVGASTAGAKGSWVTIASEIPFEAGWIALGTYLQTSVGGGNTATSLDLGCDGTVVIADLLLGHRHRYCTMFPLRLPVGATLQARVGGEL